MFKTILVPTDGSELSEKAAEAAIRFARESGAKLIVFSVAEPVPLVGFAEGAAPPPWLGEFDEQSRGETQARVDRIAAAASAAGVPCETAPVVTSLSPSAEIIDAARRYSCDLIIMASHGRKGLSRVLLGSQTQKVLSDAAIPVLVYR
jgi:nucleotide-binding universal stress UspA family protein